MCLCSVVHFVNMYQDCQYKFTLKVHLFYKWQRVQESLVMKIMQFLAELFTGVQS